ncbi:MULTISPECIES: DNA-3-methyladenine glycosylase I [Acetobacter]|jgi:DNA-3-methyladenine glycosylase I|uniref:3-methyladenine DNA glycosylase Tag n=1 Tax=Acetobacter lovaniensis TaxID=104100 RepID=A0A841QCW5_9PROT|nr:DNA-3-methyladenine glycosylase I [Acetobacter lovaniensis]MBB6456114.1 3-methyladenine DNA glycosylase Tag [Acetobacter lovaniensis]MCP1238950.1 DNA-3-methyladenine glycosylase I [Acetobacter lovaniensis]
MLGSGIIHSHTEIEATLGNAHAHLAMERQGEGFTEFVWSMVPNPPIS